MATKRSSKKTPKPKATKPKATKPKATKPKATKPKATKPKATKPKATKPKKPSAKLGVEHVSLKHAWPAHAVSGKSRSDLVFEGVKHSEGSYEVRVFMNNRRATYRTDKTVDEGYVGHFVVFGHGGCFGSQGHCNYQAAVLDPFNPDRHHPVTPIKRVVTVPQPLIDAQVGANKGVTSLTLVPIARPGNRDGRQPCDDLFAFEKVSLRSYL